VAHCRRDLLLRVHRHRLRWEDLEDCYSQATLELVCRARAGSAFATRAHIANALELRFLSRVHDRRRALGGRSPMVAALEGAVSLADDEHAVEIVDRRAAVEARVMLREQLSEIRRAAQGLTADQRLVLGSQLADVSCATFCSRYGWSREKYRKVAQRARRRLHRSVLAAETTVPCDASMSEEMPGQIDETHSPS
jgi:hypothetical protein